MAPAVNHSTELFTPSVHAIELPDGEFLSERVSAMARKAKQSVELAECVIYCRCSTEEQASSGLGLEAQEFRCRAWAEANALSVVGVVRDEGISAKTLQRPGLQEAISLLGPGRVLVALKLDRLTRTVSDFPTLAKHIEDQGGEWATVTEKFDTSSACGRLMLNMLLVLSEFERDQTAERTRAALHAKKQRRERLGRTPLGFATNEDRSVSVHDEEMATVQRARELRAQGKSLRTIAAMLEQEGHRTKRGGRWEAMTVKKLVESRYIETLESLA